MSVRNYFLNLSLNKKLIGIMVLLSFILISVLVVLYAQLEKDLVAEFESQTADLSKAIQIGVEEVTSTGWTDEERLRSYLASLRKQGIKEISIISTDDEIIASTNPARIGQTVGRERKEHIIQAELGEPGVPEGKSYNMILPVVAGDEHYGYIHLKINTDDFSALIKKNALKRILATSLVFLLGIALAVSLSLLYTKPIHRIVDAARRVASGDLSVELRTGRKDEIGELTQTFDDMVKRIREERALEEKLRETEHLSAIGQLARSIAHEIRNPLNFISLSIDRMRKKFSPVDAAQREQFESMITSIKQEIQRLNTLVKDFLDYGKPLRLNRKDANVRALIEDVIALVSAKAESDNIVITYRDEGIPVLRVDPELMKTCILNIIVNAFEAMPSGGNLTIRSGMRNGRAFIVFRDTGVGVSREHIPRLFDPFFSTKATGLGMGLAMTNRVVEEHGGKVEFESAEGKGSTVTILLPV